MARLPCPSPGRSRRIPPKWLRPRSTTAPSAWALRGGEVGSFRQFGHSSNVPHALARVLEVPKGVTLPAFGATDEGHSAARVLGRCSVVEHLEQTPIMAMPSWEPPVAASSDAGEAMDD